MALINWASGVSGDWTTAGDWTGGVVPGAGDDVTIAAPGTYTVTISSADAAHSLTLNDATATIADTGTLTLGSALTLTAGTFQLNGGTISGGVLSATGGKFVFDSGTLNALTYEGVINLTSSNASLTLSGGVTLTGSGGTGTGAINITGESALFLNGTETLDNATIDVGASENGQYEGAAIVTEGSAASVVTLGPNLTIDNASGAAWLGSVGGSGGGLGTIINDGTINLTVKNAAQAFFAIDTAVFINKGTITVDNGDFLQFSNGLTTAQLGATTVGPGGGRLQFNGTGLNNAGATFDPGADESLGGTITGGTVVGGADTTAASLTLNALTFQGEITLGYTAQLTLSGAVTLTGTGGTGRATIDMSSQYSQLFVYGATTLDNATIDVGYGGIHAHPRRGNTIEFGGPLTLGPNLTIDHTGHTASLDAGTLVNDGTINATFEDGSFTIDPVVFINDASVIVSSGDIVTVSSGTFTNQGSITVDSTGQMTLNSAFSNTGTMALDDGQMTFQSAFSNAGTIALDDNSQLTFSQGLGTAQLGVVTLGSGGGTLDFAGNGLINTGATFNVGADATLEGTITGGTVAAGANTIGSGLTLDALTYQGAINLISTKASLTLSGAVTLMGAGGAGPGTINVTGEDTALELAGTETVDNATITVGNGQTGSGAAIVDTGSAASVVTLGSKLTIDHTGTTAYLGNYLGAYGGGAGTIVNDGMINANFSGGDFIIDPATFINNASIVVSAGDTLTLSSATFTNQGSITVSTGSTAYLQPSQSFPNLVGNTLTGGSFEADAGSTIELSNNTRVTTDSAVIILSGAGSNLRSLNSATDQQVAIDSTLATISATGTLELLAGRGWSSTVSMTNAGTLDLGGGTFAPASLTNSGTVNGFGAVSGAFTDAGMVASAGGALAFVGTGDVFSGALGGTEIDFAGGTDALDAGSSLTATTVGLSGGAALTVNTNLAYAGVFAEGAATAVIASGDMLSLTGASTFDTGAVVDGAGTLALTSATLAGLTIGGTATLHDVGTVAQTGAITLGDTTSNAAKISIANGGAWMIEGDVGIARGTATASAITVAGTLAKTAGTGVSVVGVKITDNGMVTAGAGTLDLVQAISGKGAMTIDAGATLQIGASAVAGTIITTFAGAGAVLKLGAASKFAATIAGFTSGQTIDLLKTAATGASVNGSDQLVIVDGTSTVATLQLTGSYTGDTFNVTSDKKKGSDITVTLGPTPAVFAQQMAGFGGGGVAQAAVGAGLTAQSQTRLAAPGMQH